MKKIMVIAGGTGGHIFPALAVADALTKQGCEVRWLGSSYGMEKKLVPERYPIDYVKVKGLRRNGLLAKLLMPLRMLQAVLRARKIMRAYKPDVVLAMGGYVSAPGGLAARLLKIPLVIHEQNAVAGMTNRFLAKFASTILQAFPDAFPAGIDAKTVGNPVRESLSSLSSPAERYQQHQGALRVLILGGSQGARAINEQMIAVFRDYPNADALSVWHQAGSLDYDKVKKAYASLNVDAKVEAFIDDMAAAYGWADLVVCRAGALTVSEVSAVGVASVFIPYPFAVDNHQYGNAQYLQKADAALLLQQDKMDTPTMLALLQKFAASRDDLLVMATKAKEMSKLDAVQQVVDQCVKSQAL